MQARFMAGGHCVIEKPMALTAEGLAATGIASAIEEARRAHALVAISPPSYET